MTDTVTETIAQVAETTCETLTFMFAVPPPEQPVEDGPTVTARVGFQGPMTGAILVSAPEEMLPTLAANMLGTETDDIGEQQRRDAFKELANVVCGNLLPALVGPEPVFEVTPPRLIDEPDAETQADPSAEARVWLDEGWLQVALTVDGGIERVVTAEQ